MIALFGYTIARNARVTPDKVRVYAGSVNLSELSPKEREAAIRKMAEMLNALSLEERQELRMDHTAYRWFKEMTEEEKAEFIEATMPTGFKQMISAFENLPEDKRRRTVEQAMKNLNEDRGKMGDNREGPQQDTNQIVLSDALREKVTQIGLQTFYSQSSAQTKAELAPLLEEMQRVMESGRILRHRMRQ